MRCNVDDMLSTGPRPRPPRRYEPTWDTGGPWPTWPVRIFETVRCDGCGGTGVTPGCFARCIHCNGTREIRRVR
jgi:hypothetical protein